MYGPLDYIALSFAGNQFNGAILPALAEIVRQGTVRIVDLAVVAKDQDGAVTILEIEQLDPAHQATLKSLVAEITGWLSQGDLEAIGALLAPNSSAALLVWENTWATAFAQAVVQAQGQILARETIPYELVQDVLNTRETAAPSAG